jgi:alkylhydroperoxidase/carboxymuconolactone decarboxylase family protein YurZ
MFDIKEVEERIEKHEKLLEGIQKKMAELKNEFDDLTSQCQAYGEDYFRENCEKREQLSETIRKRLSVYELLKEVADDIRTKTFEDMRTLFDELQKKDYYRHD